MRCSLVRRKKLSSNGWKSRDDDVRHKEFPYSPDLVILYVKAGTNQFSDFPVVPVGNS